jgi:ribonuclease HI
MDENKLHLYTDGAARGNPGPGACAFVAVESGNVIHSGARALGRVTNNTAEYEAVIIALEYAASKGYRSVAVTSDSQLAMRQLAGEWRVRNEHLAVLHRRVKSLERSFSAISYAHVRRTNTYIQMADALANKALDEAL